MLESLRLGGTPMVLLMLLSLAAATLVIVKLWEFWECRIARRAFVAPLLEAWRSGRDDRCRAILAQERSPLAAVLMDAMAALSDARLDDAQVREHVEISARHRLDAARSFFRALDLIVQLAPLLGLFGTVLGMIDAFRQLQLAGGAVEPAALAGGIWQALLTTAAGLAVAMPVMAALQGFERLVDALRLAMESALTELMAVPRRVVTHAT